MSIWDSYQSRLNTRGETRREAVLQKEKNFLLRKLPDHLSYHTAIIDGEEREVAIINSDNFEIKTIISMPGEDITGGSLVEWMDNKWIVTAKDANNEVYTKATMTQCNYLVRWIADDGEIVERWCIIADGTKYLVGETVSQYNDNGMSLGDTRISMTIPRDPYTLKLSRDNRFLIDDYDSENVLAYRITKPFKIGGVYNGEGAITFVLIEVNTEDDDNLDLHIADYYKHFPREDTHSVQENKENISSQNGKKVWL